MRIVIAEDYLDMSRKAANILAGQIYLKPDSIIGLATGDTPAGMYRELIRMHRREGLSFKKVVTFNLDEYIGLSPDHKNSYHYYMRRNLFDRIDIDPGNTYIPDGTTDDVEAKCQEYEDAITRLGGIDLQVLGIGKNGHIGFNEPDIKFESTTHRVKLDDETRKANARFFPGIDWVPGYAISMGIKTIMSARKLMLLACGFEKAEAVYRTVNGPITPEIPASIIQLHQNVTVIIDKAANQLGRFR